MTTYYVRKTGNDGAAGTSPATAWLTIGKALGAAGISSGDTVYIGAGVYRECVTVAMVSAIAETFVIGDVDGSHTGDAGEVRITNYLTNDKTLSSGTAVLVLNGKDYLTFRNIVFHADTADANNVFLIDSTTPSAYITFTECAFFLFNRSQGYTNVIEVYGDDSGNGAPLHWLIDRCRIFCFTGGYAIYFLYYDSPATDIDADVVIRNCVIDGGEVVFSSNTNAGGMTIRNCFIRGNTSGCIGALMTSSYPVKVYGNLLMDFDMKATVGNATLNSSSINAMIEDYNIIFGQVGFVYDDLIVPGAHSISNGSYAPLFHFGQELQQGLSLRPFGMPTADSSLLGFGDDGNAPSIDIINRPRPAGGQSILKAVGAYERHDTAVKETTVFDVTPGIKIIGPGDHEFQIPVDATATTISVKARYDANHAATNKPQAILLAAPEIGVTTETETMTAAVDTWETLTFTQFTPTASGVVTVRLVSRSAADNGIAYFDTFNIS